jgi:DNA-binding CsgD family transcriptional regulator
MYRTSVMAECVRRVRNGESYRAVARSHRLCPSTVKVWCADAGVTSRHNRRWTDAEVATLIDMWSRGMGTGEIAAALGRTRKSVERYIVKHRDITPRRRARSSA